MEITFASPVPSDTYILVKFHLSHSRFIDTQCYTIRRHKLEILCEIDCEIQLRHTIYTLYYTQLAYQVLHLLRYSYILYQD